MTENEENFIKELTALSKKYKVIIGGCGCCGSPYVSACDIDKDKFVNEAGYSYDDYLDWQSPGSYGWDDDKNNYKDKVIK